MMIGATYRSGLISGREMSGRGLSILGAGFLLLSLTGMFTMFAGTAIAAEPPPFTGTFEPQGEDERGLWQEMDEREARFSASYDRFEAPDLSGYLKQVLCRTVGGDRCAAARIYITRDASFDAAMYPNGMMIVHSGLLLRLRDEAELAAVLAHEFSHFERKHALAGFQRQRRVGDFLSWASVLGAPGVTGKIFDLRGHKFDRDQEREADRLAMQYMQNSRYASMAAAHLWQRLVSEDTVQEEERGTERSGLRKAIAGWGASHPAAQERAETLTQLAQQAADGGAYARGAYRSHLAPYGYEFFTDQLRQNDFAASEAILQDIAGDDWGANMIAMNGELHRWRGESKAAGENANEGANEDASESAGESASESAGERVGDDLDDAVALFERAIAAGSNHPLVHRAYGLALLRKARGSFIVGGKINGVVVGASSKTGVELASIAVATPTEAATREAHKALREKGAAQLAKYLAARPKAYDAPLMAQMIAEARQ